MRRLSRSWRRFIAAIDRWRPSSSVALAIVSLPERRRSSSPLARVRFSSAAGAFSATVASGRPGRPASARAAGSLRGGGVDRSLLGVARLAAACGFASGAARLGGLGLASAAAAAARCSGDLASRGAARSAASFSARRRVSSASRAAVGLDLLLAALGLLRLRGLDRLQAALELGVREAGGRCRRGRRWRPEPAGAPGFGTMIRLRLCSTVTDLVRPWLKLWCTWLVSVRRRVRRPSVLPLRSPSLVSIIPSLAFPAEAFLRRSRSPLRPDDADRLFAHP